MTSRDLSTLFQGDPSAPPTPALRQGVVQAWDPDTGENSIQVAGGTLVNIPSLTAESAELVAGDVVALLTSGDRALVIGKVTTPGDPGTVPSWPTDITALQSDMTTVTTVTIPAVQAAPDTAQASADAAQADATTALGKFPITATDITDGAISTPKLSANAIDGMTITGALFRTAASGQRIEIDSPTFVNQLTFYTDDEVNDNPGLLAVGDDGAGWYVELVSPTVPDGSIARVNLGSIPAGGGAGSYMNLEADSVAIDADIEIDLTSPSVQINGSDVTTAATINPYYNAYLNANQSIPTSGTAAKVTGWVADGSPNNSGITHSSGNFTVPTTGRYRLRAQAWWAAVASPAGVRTIQWVKSPSTLLSSHTVPGNSATVPMPVLTEKTVRLTAADQVFVQVIQGQASPHNLIGTTPDITYAQLEWVGP